MSTADLMLGPSFRLPHASDASAPEAIGDVLERAIEAADDVGGAFIRPPCAFRVLPARDAEAPVWVLVTHARSPEPDHEAHLRERSRTAAQRFMLSVQCEGLDAVWVEDEAAVRAAFDGAGLRGDQDAAVGLVRCAALA